MSNKSLPYDTTKMDPILSSPSHTQTALIGSRFKTPKF